MKIQISEAKVEAPLWLLPQSSSLHGQSVTLLHISVVPGQYRVPYKRGRAVSIQRELPRARRLARIYSSLWRASAGAQEPLPRVVTKLYGKRGSQDDHVAAKHRPGGNARNARCGLARSQL